MPPIASKETERQYRVARQTLGIHGLLRDRFALKSRAAELILLLASMVFCATTFAGDTLYATFGFSPKTARFALGLASILAFGLSLTLLVLDWKDAWADHRDAARRWSLIVEAFRSQRSDNGSWPDNVSDQLSAAYWEAAHATTPIPDRLFNRLKRRYLRKVAISEMTTKYPACPPFLLSFLLRTHDIVHALRHARSDEPNTN